jgi:Thioredoxin
MSEPPAEETPSNPSFQQALAHAHAVPPPSSEPPAGDPPDDVIRFKRSRFYAALLPVAFVTGLAAGFLIWGRGGTNAGAGPNTAAIATPQRLQVSADDDPYLGPAGAAVTIVEFSDFNCPYCRQFEQTTFPELMRAYPDKIRFVYRDFPVTSQESYYAAQAAECAGDQGA